MPNNNPQQTTPQQQIARAADSANKAAERLSEGAEHATSVAIEKVRQVREEAQNGIEQQRTQVAERIRRLGGVMRASSQTLSTDDPLAQQLFDAAGDRIEQVADYISNLTPSELAHDVTSLARRRPGLFFGGSFILGLALGRFVKSSAGAVAGGDEDDGYEDTLSVRPAKRGRGRRRAAATSGASAPRSAGQVAASGAATAGKSAGGTGSTSTGTVGSGSAHGASSAPSYGASSSVTTSSKPAQSTSSTPASGAPRDVERGEGTKS